MNAIEVRGLGKEYNIGAFEARHEHLRDAVMDAVKAPLRRLRSVIRGHGTSHADVPIWALKDVSFDVPPGEVVGVVGANGAGKSTLLKILARITSPTTGHVEMRGRVGSLLEVGTGFHPELTGRENVYLSGAIQGMRKREIESRFDDIARFAEIERFLDTPVKRYSSGMYVRLAFSVAAHLDPEILLVDEVLAVGDASFQRKCLGKIGSIAHSEGRTVLFVSHNMNAVTSLCDRGLLLGNGRLIRDGHMEDIVRSYVDGLQARGQSAVGERSDREGEGGARIVGIRILDWRGAPANVVTSGQGMMFLLEVETSNGDLIDTPALCDISIKDGFGQRLAMLSTEFTGTPLNLGRRCVWTCVLPAFPFLPDRYSVDVGFGRKGRRLDHVNDALAFDVVEGDFFGTGRAPARRSKHGPFLLAHSWK